MPAEDFIRARCYTPRLDKSTRKTVQNAGVKPRTTVKRPSSAVLVSLLQTTLPPTTVLIHTVLTPLLPPPRLSLVGDAGLAPGRGVVREGTAWRESTDPSWQAEVTDTIQRRKELNMVTLRSRGSASLFLLEISRNLPV